jgi:transposase
MLHLSSSVRYFLFRSSTDMRKGFDSLAGIVTAGMQQNACSGDIFIFLNRNRTHVKLLLWEQDGFSLYYKRLEQGTYELPICSNSDTTMPITAQQLQFILQGVLLSKIVYRKRYQKMDQGY